jgi:branched-chain amino acid transport system substrate-binding protein
MMSLKGVLYPRRKDTAMMISRRCAIAATIFAGWWINSTAAAEEVHIGVLAPLSGPAASYGQDIINGIRLAAEEISAKGGIGGRKFVIDEGDDRGSPKDAANVAQKFVSDDRVVAMVGGATSTATFGAVPVAQRGKLPFLITLASHPDLTKEGNYIFRNSVTQETEGPALARLVRTCFDAKKIAVMHLNNDWAISMTDLFLKSLRPTGIEVAVKESYNPGENIDYGPKLAKVRAANTDLIWFGAQYNDLALILKQAERMNLGKPLVGSAGDHSTGLIKVAGSAADGLYLHTMFFPGDPDLRVQRFVKTFKEKFGQDPNIFSVQAYDGLFALAKAIETGRFERSAIRDALEKVVHDGVSGRIAFNPQTREVAEKTFIPLVVKNGEFTLWSDCAAKLKS